MIISAVSAVACNGCPAKVTATCLPGVLFIVMPELQIINIIRWYLNAEMKTSHDLAYNVCKSTFHP